MEEKENKSLFSGVKKQFSDLTSLIKFTFSVIFTLITFAFSVLSVIFKVIAKGWSPSTYILAGASLLYLVLIVFYYFLLKARLKDKEDKRIKANIDNFKYFIRIVKLAVPIILLFNLIGNPVYDFVMVFFSCFSILFSFISFIIATKLLINKKKKSKK